MDKPRIVIRDFKSPKDPWYYKNICKHNKLGAEGCYEEKKVIEQPSAILKGMQMADAQQLQDEVTQLREELAREKQKKGSLDILQFFQNPDVLKTILGIFSVFSGLFKSKGVDLNVFFRAAEQLSKFLENNQNFELKTFITENIKVIFDNNSFVELIGLIKAAHIKFDKFEQNFNTLLTSVQTLDTSLKNTLSGISEKTIKIDELKTAVKEGVSQGLNTSLKTNLTSALMGGKWVVNGIDITYKSSAV